MMDSSSGCQDLFDRLPDDVVLSIFDKLRDAKSICLSMSVCKRFHSIAPQVVDIYLLVPRKKSSSADQETHRSSLKNLVARTLMKPLHLISRMIRSKPKNEENDLDLYSHCVPNRILKPFGQIRALHLKLPCNGCHHKPGSITGRNTTLLKWKADFGREMHSCVILGARSWSEKMTDEKNPQESETRFLGDDELKLRIVWTISCLIAASARHYLVRETVKALEEIENVEVSDESEQGRLCMNGQQISEMKEGKDENSEYRSKVPALRMKMWFLQRVEVGGKVMEGGTLVMIRPVDGGGAAEGNDADMLAGAFGEEKALGEAVRKLMVAKKCYTINCEENFIGQVFINYCW